MLEELRFSRLYSGLEYIINTAGYSPGPSTPRGTDFLVAMPTKGPYFKSAFKHLIVHFPSGDAPNLERLSLDGALMYLPKGMVPSVEECYNSFYGLLAVLEEMDCGSWSLHSIVLGLLGYLVTMVGDAGAPFTGRTLQNPKQPNRDHNFGHVVTASWIGCRLLEEKNSNNKTVMDELNDLVTSSPLYAAVVGDNDDLKPEDVQSAIRLGWLVASICHDAAYPLQMGRWLANPMNLASLCGKNGDRLLTDNLKDEATRTLHENAPALAVWMHESFAQYLSKSKKPDEDAAISTDHSEEMAAFMLHAIVKDIRLGKMPLHHILAAALAVDGVLWHTFLSGNLDATMETLKQRIEWAAEEHPMGLFLACADLLAEANRVHWSLLHVHPDERKEFPEAAKLFFEHGRFAGLANNHGNENWERIMVLGGIVGIQGVRLTVTGGYVSIEYDCAFDSGMIYGYSKTHATADPSKLIEGMYCPALAVHGLGQNSKDKYVTIALNRLTRLNVKPLRVTCH